MNNEFQSVRIEKPWISSQYKYHEQQSIENVWSCIDAIGWNKGIRKDIKKEMEELRFSGINIQKVTKILTTNVKRIMNSIKGKIISWGINAPDYKKDFNYEIIYLVSPVTITNGEMPNFNYEISSEYLDCRGIAIVKYARLHHRKPRWDVFMCINTQGEKCFSVKDIYKLLGETDRQSEATANLVVSDCVRRILNSGYSFSDVAYNMATNFNKRAR